MGFKERLAAANAKAKEARVGQPGFKEKMAAANADLKTGLAATKENWDGKRADLAVERAENAEAAATKKDERAKVKEAAQAERDASILARSSAYARSSANADHKSGSVLARRADKGESFEGVTLKAGRVDYKGQGGPVEGATARVESAADAHRRLTATRFLFAGGVMSKRKQVGHVFLTVESPGFAFVVEVPAKKEADARGFAAKINNAAKRGA